MGFSSQQSLPRSIGLVVGLIVAGLAVRFFLAGGIEEYFNPQKRVENQIEAALKANPGDLALMEAIETHFPLQYDKMLDRLGDAAIQAEDEETLLLVINNVLQEFMASHRNDFAYAPTQNLRSVLADEEALVDLLSRENPTMCSDYLFGRIEVTDETSQELRTLFGKSVASRVEAMATGRRDQQMRLAVTPSLVAKLRKSMVQEGASEAQLAMLFDQGDPGVLSSAQQCEALQKLHAAVGKMPDEDAALLIGTLLNAA